MGNFTSMKKGEGDQIFSNSDQSSHVNANVIPMDSLSQYSYGVAEDYVVQHYCPPHFPIVASLSASYLITCAKTWELVQNAGSKRMKQYGKPGIVLFYDEFFYRLFQRDSTMEEVFPSVKKRGEVLVKALAFILASKANNEKDIEDTRNKCRFLGLKHRTFVKVRPHHFAGYTSTLIEVVMYWLGEYASPDVGEAWSNCVGFVLRYILEPYLWNRTDPYESYQNTMIAAVREITDSSNCTSESSASASARFQSEVSAR